MIPILLYTLPRARGTAALKACKRYPLNEPFSHLELINPSEKQWSNLVLQMNAPSSCVKIHPGHLCFRPQGLDWYLQVLKEQSHKIYVVERIDRVNQFLSCLIAFRFGWNAKTEIEPFNINISKDELYNFKTYIQQYLKYYPSYGQVFQYNKLPEIDFDLSKVQWTDQQSHLKHKYITNLDQCVEILTEIIELYKKEWDEKIMSLSPDFFKNI
jgi:hypothetical protein